MEGSAPVYAYPHLRGPNRQRRAQSKVFVGQAGPGGFDDGWLFDVFISQLPPWVMLGVRFQRE
jgi:hypothetical protein